MAATRQAATSQEVAELRRRVEELEAEVARLKREAGSNGTAKKKAVSEVFTGQFEGDPVFAEIIKAGRAWREAQRPRKRAARARP